MRASVMYGARDVRVAHVTDATLVEAIDAIVRIPQPAAAYGPIALESFGRGQSMGRQAIGAVKAASCAVGKVKVSGVLIMPFLLHLQRSSHDGFFGWTGFNGAQAEARVRLRACARQPGRRLPRHGKARGNQIMVAL